ncbi:MAG: hypothetical protein U0103_16770 [Candidatus Obscuribacterales bacterium]
MDVAYAEKVFLWGCTGERNSIEVAFRPTSDRLRAGAIVMDEGIRFAA